jgi:hypothetical protein
LDFHDDLSLFGLDLTGGYPINQEKIREKHIQMESINNVESVGIEVALIEEPQETEFLDDKGLIELDTISSKDYYGETDSSMDYNSNGSAIVSDLEHDQRGDDGMKSKDSLDISPSDEIEPRDNLENLDELEELIELEDVDELDDLEDIEDIEELDDLEEGDDLEELEDQDKIEDPADVVKIDFAAYLQKAGIELEKEVLPESESEEEILDGKITSESFMQGMDSLVQNLAEDLLPQISDDDLDIDEYSIRDEVFSLKMTEEGLDFDKFRSHYRSGSLGLLKSLRDLTREYKALSGILMKKVNNRLVTVHSIGINEDGVDSLSSANIPVVLNQLTSERGIVFIKNKDHSSLEHCFAHPDFRLFKCWVFMPLVSNEGFEYIFLGYKDSSQSLLGELFG